MTTAANSNAMLLTGELARLSEPLAGGSVAGLTWRSPIKETVNEDAAGVVRAGETSGLLIIADGCGGHPCAQEAAQLAINTMASLVGTEDDDGDLREVILRGFDEANKAVLGPGVGAACTLSVVTIQDGVARPYFVGDSQILIVGQRGKIHTITTPHSPVGYGVQAGLIDEADALHHHERHIVSNVVGSQAMHVETGAPIELAARDTVLIASDGLFDNLMVDEIVQIIRAGSLDDSLDELFAKCEQRMLEPKEGEPSKPDDLSVLLYRPTGK